MAKIAFSALPGVIILKELETREIEQNTYEAYIEKLSKIHIYFILINFIFECKS
jgi:hypothetical protein